MSKINILQKEVYQLIAAGEVVERPSSVVKELVENSIDAGAKNITIEIKNGGSTYIRITDDGQGIEKDDIRKVFISHATSKIKEQNDLDAISTLGFRGEAMASISAVAKVELLTKTGAESDGSRYVIAGGEEQNFDDAGCPNGTTLVVRDMFFNTPARMKFLKKDVTEGNSVAGLVDAFAISHPEIAFRFIRDGKQVLVTSGKNDLKSTIYSVFGKELSESLIFADYTMNGMRVSGFVSKPSAGRKSRAMQFFFINGRMVKSKTAFAALEQAYKNRIMSGRFPACFLNIEIDTSLVDVNVHPAKIEVRFVNEKPVFDLIYYCVKSAIETGDSVKTANFFANLEDVYAPTVKKHEKTYAGKADFFIKKEKPVQTVFCMEESKPQAYVAAPSAVYETHEESETLPEAKEPPKIIDETEITPSFSIVGEAFKTYIIVQIENDLYLIDKHAAHERMNFESLKNQAEIHVQMLLSPVAVRLTKDEFTVITENLELLAACGFETEEFGVDTVVVRAVPAMLGDADIADLICEIAKKLLEHKTDIEPDKIDWIFHSASCRAAVKAGDYTSEQERELFVKKLLSMPDIRYCPHGRPVMIKLSKYDIEKQFGRS